MTYHAPNPNHNAYSKFMKRCAAKPEKYEVILNQKDNLIDCQNVKFQFFKYQIGQNKDSLRAKVLKGTFVLFQNGFSITYDEGAFKEKIVEYYDLSQLLQVIPLYESPPKYKELEKKTQNSFATSLVLNFYKPNENRKIYVDSYKLMSSKEFNANRFYLIILKYLNYIFSKQSFVVDNTPQIQMDKSAYNSSFSRPEISFNYFWNENKSNVESMLSGPQGRKDKVMDNDEKLKIVHNMLKKAVDSLILHNETITFISYDLYSRFKNDPGVIRYKYMPSVLNAIDVARNIENLVFYNVHHIFNEGPLFEIDFQDFNFLLTKFFMETNTIKKVSFEMSKPQNAYQFTCLLKSATKDLPKIKSYFIKAINIENMKAFVEFAKKNRNVEEIGFLQNMDPDIKPYKDEVKKQNGKIGHSRLIRRLKEVKSRHESFNYLLHKVSSIIDAHLEKGYNLFKSFYFKEFTAQTILKIIGAFDRVPSLSFIDVSGPPLTLKQISEIIYSGCTMEFHFNNIAMKGNDDDYLFALPPRTERDSKYMFPSLISIAETEWSIEGLLSVFKAVFGINKGYRITLSFPQAKLDEPWNNFFSELFRILPESIDCIEGFEITGASSMTADLFNFLDHCPNLKTLNLKGVIQSNLLYPLRNLILKKNSQIKSLDISDNNLNGADVESLVETVIQSNLEEFRMPGHSNKRKQDVFLKLLDSKTLKVLDISSNVMQLGKIRQIADQVKCKNRGKLQIVWPHSTLASLNSISAKDVGDLYQAIYESANLKEPRVTSQGIGLSKKTKSAYPLQSPSMSMAQIDYQGNGETIGLKKNVSFPDMSIPAIQEEEIEKEAPIKLEDKLLEIIDRRMLNKENIIKDEEFKEPKEPDKGKHPRKLDLDGITIKHILDWLKLKQEKEPQKSSDRAIKTYAQPKREPIEFKSHNKIPEDILEKYFEKYTDIGDQIYSFNIVDSKSVETDVIIALKKAIENDDHVAVKHIGMHCYINEEIIRTGPMRKPTLPILYAAQISTLEVVKALEEAGADIFGTDRRGNNILMVAAGVDLDTIRKPRSEKKKEEAENIDEVKKAEKKEEEEKKERAIIAQNNANIINYLLTELNFNPNIVNSFGDTALHLACLSHNAKAVEILRDNGADRDMMNIAGVSPYGIATKDHDERASIIILGKEKPWPVSSVVCSSKKPYEKADRLDEIIRIFNPQKVEKMMKFIEMKREYIPMENSGDFVDTLLMAIKGEFIKFVDRDRMNEEEVKELNKQKIEMRKNENRVLLIKALYPFCNLEAHSYMNQTALHCACVYGTPEIIKVLVEVGADVNARRADEKPFLFYENGNPIIVGATPLMVISERFGNKYAADFDTEKNFTKILLELANLFYENGANINAQDSDGFSVVKNSNSELQKYLNEKGADKNIIQNENKNRLNYRVLFSKEKKPDETPQTQPVVEKVEDKDTTLNKKDKDKTKKPKKALSKKAQSSPSDGVELELKNVTLPKPDVSIEH